MNFILPTVVHQLLNYYQEHGFESYLVGGSVRDLLLGKTPQDWDICTNALPKESLIIFNNYTLPCEWGKVECSELGIKFGTIKLLINGIRYEVTTFRTEEVFTNHRHPEHLLFILELEKDLERRDFTINAMAFRPDQGLIDFFQGQRDLNLQLIRCVGNPEQRFQEDALRILRAIRFASKLGFQIEIETAQALINQKNLIMNISSERIVSEFSQILLTDNVLPIFLTYFDIFLVFIPELAILKNFHSHTPGHSFDLLIHTLKSIDHAPKDLIIRLTMLFHDLGKSQCRIINNDFDHDNGHQEISMEIAERVLKRLKYPNYITERIIILVKYHDYSLTPEQKKIKKLLRTIGFEIYQQLLEVQYANTLAKSDLTRREYLLTLQSISLILKEIQQQEQCFSLLNLAVKGIDLREIGLPQGPVIGKYLNLLLELVIEERLENNKEQLLKWVRDNYKATKIILC